MKRIILLVLAIGCEAPEEPSARSTHGATPLTARSTDTGDPASPQTGLPGVLSGGVVYPPGGCPVPGRDRGEFAPLGALFQGRECTASGYGLICGDASTQITAAITDDGVEVFFLSCDPEKEYTIDWIAPR